MNHDWFSPCYRKRVKIFCTLVKRTHLPVTGPHKQDFCLLPNCLYCWCFKGLKMQRRRWSHWKHLCIFTRVTKRLNSFSVVLTTAEKSYGTWLADSFPILQLFKAGIHFIKGTDWEKYQGKTGINPSFDTGHHVSARFGILWKLSNFRESLFLLFSGLILRFHLPMDVAEGSGSGCLVSKFLSSCPHNHKILSSLQKVGVT